MNELKICPICGVHFDSTFVCCSQACVEEGLIKKDREYWLLRGMRQNIQMEREIVDELLTISSRWRDFILMREQLGLPMNYYETSSVKPHNEE